MWSTDPIAPGDLLRQGDLIADSLYPVVAHPYRFIGAAGSEPAKGSDLVLRTGSRPLLVVSQCCEVEKGLTVAVAPVKKQNVKKPGVREALMATDPEPGLPFVYNMLALDCVADLTPLEHQVHVADFSEIVSIQGAEPAMREGRVARMTPQGREQLRSKLLHFWARVEAGDAIALGRGE